MYDRKIVNINEEHSISDLAERSLNYKRNNKKCREEERIKMLKGILFL